MHVLDGPDLALVSSLTSTLHSFVLVLERAPAHDISASHPTNTPGLVALPCLRLSA